MTKFDEIYLWLGKQLAVFFDKFKVTPVVWIFIESILGSMATLIAGDAIDIPNISFLVGISYDLASDKIVVGIILAFMAAVSPRTTFLKNLSNAEKVQDKA